MRSAKHINWLDFGTFQGTCLLIVGFDFNEAKSIIKKKKTSEEWLIAFESTENLWGKDNWGFASKRIVGDTTYFFLVLRNRFDFKDDSHARLAHEVLHLVSFQLKDLLNPIEENECFAYSHTYLMKQCYKILRS